MLAKRARRSGRRKAGKARLVASPDTSREKRCTRAASRLVTTALSITSSKRASEGRETRRTDENKCIFVRPLALVPYLSIRSICGPSLPASPSACGRTDVLSKRTALRRHVPRLSSRLRRDATAPERRTPSIGFFVSIYVAGISPSLVHPLAHDAVASLRFSSLPPLVSPHLTSPSFAGRYGCVRDASGLSALYRFY